MLGLNLKKVTKRFSNAASALIVLASVFSTEILLACPTCIGDAGKDRAALLTSMMVLFVITVCMLSAFGAFFFYIQRRSILYNSGLISSDAEKPEEPGSKVD